MTSGMPNAEATVVIFYITIIILIVYIGVLLSKNEQLEKENKRLKQR